MSGEKTADKRAGFHSLLAHLRAQREALEIEIKRMERAEYECRTDEEKQEAENSRRKLKPCPFCGSSYVAVVFNGHAAMVQCEKCGAEMAVNVENADEEGPEAIKRAKEKWNTRRVEIPDATGEWKGGIAEIAGDAWAVVVPASAEGGESSRLICAISPLSLFDLGDAAAMRLILQAPKMLELLKRFVAAEYHEDEIKWHFELDELASESQDIIKKAGG